MERHARRRYFKAEARRLLGQRDQLFTFILASLALVMLTVAWQVIVDGFFAFFDFGLYSPEPPLDAAVEAARTVLYWLGFLLLLMPLWYGLCAISWTAVTGEGAGKCASTGQLFAAFDSPRTLFRVWRASLWMAWRFALAGGLVWAMWYSVGLLAPVMSSFSYFSLCAAAVVLTPVLLLPLVGAHLLFPLLLTDPEIGVFSALRTATRLAFRALGETLTFWFSFAGWFALAFVTGGVMLVLYVLPYFILADTEYALYLLARGGRPITITTKEIHHVQQV